MPRTLGMEYPAAIHHVIHRGDRREDIFRDDADRTRFLETLGEACALRLAPAEKKGKKCKYRG